jgi:hypothetical protein
MGLVRWVGRAIGLDVHRDFCVVAICEDGKVRSEGRVPSTPEGLQTLAESLLATDRVALEVTGSCWEVARILEPHADRVIVVSPDDTGIANARAETDRREVVRVADQDGKSDVPDVVVSSLSGLIQDNSGPLGAAATLLIALNVQGALSSLSTTLAMDAKIFFGLAITYAVSGTIHVRLGYLAVRTREQRHFAARMFLDLTVAGSVNPRCRAPASSRRPSPVGLAAQQSRWQRSEVHVPGHAGSKDKVGNWRLLTQRDVLPHLPERPLGANV